MLRMRPSFTQLASADSGESETEEQHELVEESPNPAIVSTSSRASMRFDCVLVDPPPYKRRHAGSQAEKIDDTSPASWEPMSSPDPSSSLGKRQRVSYSRSLCDSTSALSASPMKSIGGQNSAASAFGLLTPTSSATVQCTAYHASFDVEERVSSSSETDIVCGTNPASEELATHEDVEDSSSQASLIGKPSPDVPPGQSHTGCRETPRNKRPARRDPSPGFELLEMPDFPSWVSTGVPSEADEGDFSEREREVFLPPGLASIISAMKDTLAAERATRLRAEARYEQETRLRAAAQRDAEREARLRAEAERAAAQLRAENARIQQRHRDWIATTSGTLVENLAQLSERLLAEGIELVFPSAPSASHALPVTQGKGASSGGAAVHSMAVDT